MNAARLIDVSRRYGKRWALIHLSVEIPEGRTVLLTGSNGAGKTTLLRILGTALTPSKGHVEVFGLSTRNDTEAIRRRVGLVTHHSHLYEDLTAKETLALLARLDRHVDASQIPAVIERVGLAPRADSATRTYSAGMRRRLSLARLLLQKPDLVLFDEPFTELDPDGVTLVEAIVRDIQARGATLVMSTHDVGRGRAISDLHMHLVGGRLSGPLTRISVDAASEGKA